MKKIVRFLKIIVITLIVIITIGFFVFYRKDLSVETLEKDYFTERSFYFTSEIADLLGNSKSINIHYQDYGNIGDPVIVLLHGAFSSSHTFIPWSMDLVENQYRVILIDLPYHGLSSGFNDQVTSLRRSAAVVKSLLDHLQIDEVLIGGNSMGGGVSWYFTATYHQVNDFKVQGLILIDSIYPMETLDQNRERFTNLVSHDWIASLVSQMTPRFLLKNILENVYGSSEMLTDESIDRYYNLLRREGNRKAILVNESETLDFSEGISMLHQIRDYEIPVLIMWGELDTWIPVETAQLFKEMLVISDEYIYIFESLGHVPMEEAPNLTIDPVIEFINDIE